MYPVIIYFFKVNNKKTRESCEICSKLTFIDVVLVFLLLNCVSIVDFEQVNVSQVQFYHCSVRLDLHLEDAYKILIQKNIIFSEVQDCSSTSKRYNVFFINLLDKIYMGFPSNVVYKCSDGRSSSVGWLKHVST